VTDHPAYCLHCFALLPAAAEVCPHCGGNPAEGSGSYAARLVHALGHPLAEVRMRAIIALGLRSETEAADALADCALRHPADVVEGLEIVRSLARIAETGEPQHALARIAHDHPARAVRQAAEGALKTLADSPLPGPSDPAADPDRR
jgi:HEAT repeat protein